MVSEAFVAGQTPGFEMRHLKILIPKLSELTALLDNVGAIILALPEGMVQRPVLPLTGALPVSIVVGLLIQSI